MTLEHAPCELTAGRLEAIDRPAPGGDQALASHLALAGALALALSLAGCADAAAPALDRSASVDTLPGGVVHVRNDGTAWSEGGSWKPVEVARIGAVDADDPYLFSAAWALSLALDSRDRLYVADLQLAEVRLFDADGTFVRTVAAQGEGPGEVLQPLALGVDADDRLWVVDPRNRRFSVFDSAGALVATHRRDVGSFGLYNQFEPGDAGTHLYEQSGVATSAPDAPPRQRSSAPALIRWTLGDGGAAPADTFIVATGAEADSPAFVIDYGDGSWASRTVPYARELRWTFAPDGSVWSGTGETYRLVHRAFGGDTLRIVEMPDAAEPVDPELVASSLAWMDDLTPELRSQVDLDLIPDTAPQFDGVVVDDREHVWVSLGWRPLGQATEPARFDIFAPDGRYRGRLELPFDPRPWPAIRGDRITGVVTNELDVPQVVVYRLEGR